MPDLRALLLEMAGQPPRLKQDHSLFQKEEARFDAVFDPLPDWLKEEPRDHRKRRDRAIVLGKQAHLVHPAAGLGDVLVLDLTDEGHRWLGLSLEEQYADLFALYRTPDKDSYWGVSTDSHFLGSNITSLPAKGGKQQDLYNNYSYRPLTPQERQPLRDAVYRLFAELPVGTFYKMEDFLDRSMTGARNPLLLQTGDVSRMVIRQEMRIVPPLEEYLEEVARALLRTLLLNRLIPLGCIQAARDGDEHLLIARRPRLDVYFGKAKVAPAAPEMEVTRVVVQPDFSVIVIGLNPAPAVDLAPFCERVRGRSSQGSLTFRITRDSVLKALAAGVAPEQVIARLEKHASTPIPKNVATEVRGWCEWTRRVTPTPATLLRCPDRAAADRVMGGAGQARRAHRRHRRRHRP